MVYSSAERVQEPLREPDPRRGRARLRIDGQGDGRAEIVGSKGAILGRSRDADVVIDDPNVSRHHAEIRPSGGSWIVNDLGSTNGIKVNGRRVDGPQSLKRGDVIEIGTSRVTFELE
jgi:pSer/pThr/pTyr-binding forkhead associated (FHA) protein